MERKSALTLQRRVHWDAFDIGPVCMARAVFGHLEITPIIQFQANLSTCSEVLRGQNSHFVGEKVGEQCHSRSLHFAS